MSRSRDLGLFVLIVLLFGSAFPAIKAGLRFTPPLLFAATRYYLSALLLLGYAGATSDRWIPRTAADRGAVLAGGTLFIGATGLSFVGVSFIPSGVAAILFGLVPILTVVFAHALLPDEDISRRGLLGVLVGFVGVVIVVRPGGAALGGSALIGELLVLAAAVGVALGTVVVRRSHPPMSVVALTGWAMLLGATIQLGFALALGESPATVRVTPTALAVVLYLSVVVGGVGFVTYFHLIDRFGPTEVNMITYLNPVVALVTGWAILDEPIPEAALLGLFVILVGFLLLKNKEVAARLAVYRGAGR